MPRPKASFDDYKHLFEGVNYKVSTDNFNVNSKIVITCDFGHEYNTSITKIKSLGHNYKICPHCIKKEKYNKTGIPVSKIEHYCSMNELTFYPKKEFYNRWRDSIVFECKNGHKHEAKSLSYWENTTAKSKFVCSQCEIQSLGLMTDETLSQYLSSYNPVKAESPNILPSFDSSKLPESLKLQLESYIKSLGVETVSEHKEYGIELDIFIPSHKIAIEYCGLVWHSTKYKNDRNCHLNKLKICESKGVKLLTIFEDEWLQKQDICKSRINHILGINSKRIFGRKCQVSSIDNKVALRFCEENHIQGRGQANQSVGLFYNNDLVAVMTFSKPSTAKSASGYDWELNRFCNRINTYVVGGADKMLKYFIKANKGSTIVSFADKRWSTGNVYDKLMFVKDKETAPNYYYFGKNTKYKRLHRFNFTKAKLMKLMGLEETPLSETELAKAYGLYRIYDCGHIKYIIKL